MFIYVTLDNVVVAKDVLIDHIVFGIRLLLVFKIICLFALLFILFMVDVLLLKFAL